MKKKHNLLLKNYMEDIARNNIDQQLLERDDVCKCEQCRLDMLAYALNHLAPKYVVSDRGHIFTRLQEMETQFNTDVTREVYKTIEFIKQNKRHGAKTRNVSQVTDK